MSSPGLPRSVELGREDLGLPLPRIAIRCRRQGSERSRCKRVERGRIAAPPLLPFRSYSSFLRHYVRVAAHLYLCHVKNAPTCGFPIPTGSTTSEAVETASTN